MSLTGRGSSSIRKKDVMEQTPVPYGYVYLVTNLSNGKLYVGKTLETIESRWSRHLRTQHKSVLHKAISKYGKDTFQIKELAHVSADMINEQEQYWISKLDTMAPNGYNLTIGGDGSYGFRHTSKTKEKMSKAKLGKSISKNARIALDSVLKNNPPRKNAILSDETKQKISKANIGRKFTKQQLTHIKDKIRQAIAKPVECYSIQGEKVAEFLCTVDAYTWLNKKPTSTIRECCLGINYRKTAYGYVWKFKEVEDVANR